MMTLGGKRLLFLVLLLMVAVGTCRAMAEDDNEFGDSDGAVHEAEEEGEDNDEGVAEQSVPKEEYHAPDFQPPTITPEMSQYFIELFEDPKSIGKRWHKSLATKEGAEADLAKYNGEWAVEAPSKEVLKNDYGLIVKTKARHHAISATLRKPFLFEGKPLVVQYEVKYEDGQECGGGYIKLLSVGTEKVEQFKDTTPYSIMFGPDKCGQSAKVHLIIRHKNPKNGEINEHHARQPTKPLTSFFDDRLTHLYTLIIRPDNTFQVLIDNSEVQSGSLLKDLEPAVEPSKVVADPNDKRPAEWDDDPEIEDPEAKKPSDWDESQPKQVLDEGAVKPSDWLEEEETLVPDASAKKPSDWDNEMDGEWAPPMVNNPKCEGVSGCGKWTRPMKENPLYKGKWSAPKIANPAYKGEWKPKEIPNLHYFEADPYKQLTGISAVGFELWTMSSGIVFDNILITDSEAIAVDFSRQTWAVKAEAEQKYERIENPAAQSIVSQVLAATEERPWLWAVFVLALLVPVILISIFCFGRKSRPMPHPKKTDAQQTDDDEGEEADEEEPEKADPTTDAQVENEGEEEEVAVEEKGEPSTSSSSSKAAAVVEPEVANTPASPPRKARQRRQD